jgi:hypothetical protein
VEGKGYLLLREKIFITEKGIQLNLFEVNNEKEIEYKLPIYNIHDDIDYNKVKIISNYPHTNLRIEIKDNNL